jgi:phenylacetate-CoA ligase
MRALHHWGVRWHHRRVQVRPGHFNWSRNWALEFLNRFRMYRLTAVSCFDPPAQIYQNLAGLQPDYLGGYPQVLEMLSLWMSEQGLPALPARWVSCGGESLSPLARARIQRALPQAKVVETYGSVEFNLLAWQCPDTPWLHLCEDGVRVEILDEQDRPVAEGQPGRLVGTALQSFAMPLIRVELGDRVLAGPRRCPCGRPFATLARVEGRLLDSFWLPDGSCIHPFELTSPLLTECSLEWLQRYQIVQEEPTSLVFRYLSNSSEAASQAEGVGRFLQTILGRRACLRTEPVDHFEEPVNGKFRIYRPLPRPF